MDRKKWNIFLIMMLTVLVAIFFFTYTQAQIPIIQRIAATLEASEIEEALNRAGGQNWVALPPYNVLWPLWSPALSPIDPVTGLVTPLVTSLTSGTVLPVQPGIIWDPASVEALHGPLPWLAYNIPLALGGGLVIWDQFYGLRPFPLDYMLDPITLNPLPIPLPLAYSLLDPIGYDHLWLYELMLGNTVYSSAYGVPITGLLTPQDIWGLPPLGAPPLE